MKRRGKWETRIRQDRMSILQENNDYDHETRLKESIIVRFKIINWIDTLIAFFAIVWSELVEAVWNNVNLKERVKHKQMIKR